MSRVWLPVTFLLFMQADPVEKPRAYWLPVANEYIAHVEVTPRTDQPLPFARQPEPIFHHIQSVRGKSVGSVFLYTEPSGRPAAVNDVFFLKSGKKDVLYTEFHSLASTPLTVRSPEGLVGECPMPGLTWNTIPDAGEPGDKPVARNRQVTQLVRRFTAHLVNRNQDRFELRLLPTPLYRFDASDAKECLGGALLVFCQETDPEIFLLLEARRSGERFQWKFAAAEFSNLDLFVELDGKEVWSANPPQFSRNGPHWGGPVRDVKLPMADGQ